MWSRLQPAILVVGIALASAAESVQDAPVNPGHVVYQKWCTPCHGAGPNHPGTQALEAKYRGEKPGALEERTDLAPEFTKQMVRKGVSIMPFFRKTEISDADLDALAAYLSKSGG